MKNAYRKDYFFRIHNEMMKIQLKRPLNKTAVEDEVEPLVEHQLKERTQLQRIICDFSKGLSPEAIVSRKVSADERTICHSPVCKAEGWVLNDVMHFKNQVATVHKVNLRAFRS